MAYAPYKLTPHAPFLTLCMQAARRAVRGLQLLNVGLRCARDGGAEEAEARMRVAADVMATAACSLVFDAVWVRRAQQPCQLGH